jgi:hypothetical protein
VGPWSDRIATFLGYPPGLVQVVAARLYEGRTWENEEVRSDLCFLHRNELLIFLYIEFYDCMEGCRLAPKLQADEVWRG